MYEASRVNVKVERFSFNVYAQPFSHQLSLFYLQGRVNFTLFNLLTLPSHKSLWLSFTVLSYRLRNCTYRNVSFLKRFSGVTGIRCMLFLERSLKEIVMQFSSVSQSDQMEPTPRSAYCIKNSFGLHLSSSKQLIIQSDNATVQFYSLKKQGPYRKYWISLVDNCLDLIW